MIRINDESQFLSLFRPHDRDLVRLPSEMFFPLLIQDYIAWMEPGGHRTFLVFEDVSTGSPLGVVFKVAHSTGEPVAKMCEWCHSVRGGDRVAMLSVTVSPKRRVGMHLCSDLSCKEKVTGIPGISDMRETVEPDIKVRQILGRMADFAHANLF